MKLSKMRQHPRMLATMLAVGIATAGAAYAQDKAITTAPTSLGSAMAPAAGTPDTLTPNRTTIGADGTTKSVTSAGSMGDISAGTSATTAPGASSSTTTSTTTDMGSGSTLMPTKTDSADAAFGKLDSSGKGYITREQVKNLPGFDAMFDRYNAKRDGRLTRDEFAQAWSAYSKS